MNTEKLEIMNKIMAIMGRTNFFIRKMERSKSGDF